VICRVYPGGRAAGMGAGGTGDAACVAPRLAGGMGGDGGSLDETQPDTTRPISTIAGTRIKFLRSVGVGLRAKDRGVGPDLKQKINLLSLALMTVACPRALSSPWRFPSRRASQAGHHPMRPPAQSAHPLEKVRGAGP